MQLPRLERLRGGGVLTLGRHPSEADRGRSFVAHACREQGYDDEVAETARLLASELITNALKHGTGDITLLVTPVSGGLRVDVADDSPAMPRGRRATWDDEDGRGLVIVDRLAASWGVERLPQGVGKSIWFTLPGPR